MSNIHPTAIIEPGATIGEHVTIEAYAVIKKNVTLKDHVVIKSHVYIDGHTTIGRNTVVYPFVSIGTKTQDLKYRGEVTYVIIGENCEIRECVTINSSCGEKTSVIIGSNTLVMAYCHIAHNCEIGSHVIMSNNVQLAGHVIVEDYAIIGGMTPVHQFSRIGQYAMVGGFSRVYSDIPPYTLGAGYPYRIAGLNMIGLKRRNFPIEIRNELAKAFRITYRSGLPLAEALAKIEKELERNEYIEHWIHFCKSSKRGIIDHTTKVEEKETVENVSFAQL